jgi:hypothetical protein
MFRRLLKHISIVLLLVFSYPVVYQALHIPGHQHDCSGCESDESFEDITIAQFSTNSPQKGCPVCIYEISISELPHQNYLPVQPFRLITEITAKVFEISIAENYHNKTPRGPPVLALI